MRMVGPTVSMGTSTRTITSFAMAGRWYKAPHQHRCDNRQWERRHLLDQQYLMEIVRLS